jgi:hypothetical protein
MSSGPLGDKHLHIWVHFCTLNYMINYSFRGGALSEKKNIQFRTVNSTMFNDRHFLLRGDTVRKIIYIKGPFLHYQFYDYCFLRGRHCQKKTRLDSGYDL